MHVLTIALPLAIALACCFFAFVLTIAFVLAIAPACCYAFVLSLRPGLVHLHLPWAIDLALDYRPCRVYYPPSLTIAAFRHRINTLN